ncbi:hypothetical protein T08_15538 [Trichinella sp. T8]|nr:hypothetical protein T08_15538 [Trichinella sp. T8]
MFSLLLAKNATKLALKNRYFLTTFCKIHEANDRFQCSTAFCTFRSPTDVTRHFFALKTFKSKKIFAQHQPKILMACTDFQNSLKHCPEISKCGQNVQNPQNIDFFINTFPYVYATRIERANKNVVILEP